MFRPEKKEVPEKARLAQKSKDAVFFFLLPFRFYVKKKSKIRKGRNLAADRAVSQTRNTSLQGQSVTRTSHYVQNCQHQQTILAKTN